MEIREAKTYYPAFIYSTMRLRAFGMSEPRQWSPQTFASTNGIFSYIEPDPGITWNQERISDLPYIKGCGSVTIIINKIKKSTFLIIIGTKFIQAILHKAYN